MKPLLLFCILIASFADAKSALPYHTLTSKYVCTEVSNIDSASTDTSDSRTKNVIGKLFVNGKDKPQLNNASNKKAGKVRTEYSTSDELISAILGRFGLY